MPSSGSSKTNLYLGKSLSDLNRISEVKPFNSNVSTIIKSSDKVFKDAEKCESQGDEEKAFVLYMRYFNLLKQVKARPEYRKQKEFFDNLIGNKNQLKAIDRAEKLSESLKQRYDLREAETVAQKLGKIDAEEEKKSSLNNKAAKDANKQDTKSEAQETPSSLGSISCSQLCNLLRDTATKLILMDVRSASDYFQSHVSHTDCISVPEDILSPGSTVSHIELKLTDESKAVWQNRKHVDHIIIIDWTSRLEDVKIGTPVKTLKDALFKFDTSVIIKSEPLVLEGGYEEWLILYPTLTTNAHVSVPHGAIKNKPPSPTFTLNFDFPDLDDDGKKIVSQPSVAASNGSISSPNGLSSNPVPLMPKIDRSLKPSFPMSPVIASANRSPQLNNAGVMSVNDPQNVKNKPETSALGSDLYPQIIPAPRLENGTSDKNMNIIRDTALPKNVNLTVKNDLTTDLSESVHQRQTEEDNLKQFKVNRDYRLQADNEKVDDLQRKLQELELIKKKEEKDVADLMRMKRKIKEELDQEKKKLAEDKQILDKEEEDRISALEKAKQDEEEKKCRLAEVEQLRVRRKLEEQTIARQKEEEERKRAEEAALLKEKEELAASERKELERLREAEAQRKQHEEEEEARKKKAEEDERQRQEELKLQAQREEEKNQAEAKRQKEEEKRLEEERKQKEMEKVKREQEEKADQKAQAMKASQSSPSKTASATQLPTGWEKRLDKASNRYYYIDHNHGVTQWTAPTTATTSSKADGISITKLKEEPAMPSSRGLSRSHSSPDIMKQLADEEKARRAQQQQQLFDRSSKPNRSSNKPLVRHTAYSMRKRDLNPVFGNVGGALTGLRNLGNTCYMNSTVQCLSNTSPLVTYFLNETFLDDINRDSEKGMHGEVVDEFAVVIKALWSGQYRSITPRDLKGTIGKYNPMFASYDQQDSQEFLTFLLDGLHEGLNEVRNAPDIPEQNNDRLTDSQAASQAWEHHKLLHRSFIVELFQGQLKSTLMCRTCEKTSTTFQPFMFLSLPIPKSSRCNLQNCIQEFLKPEMMTGSSKWKCTRCKIERDSEKKIDIWRLPPILLIGLNRFYSDGMWMQKKTNFVDFPVQDLDMTPWTASPSNRSRYSLYGISNHYGTMEGGHYTAVCRNPVNTRWYKYDDQDVHEIHASDIKTSAAFVLYYTSIPLKAPLYNPRL